MAITGDVGAGKSTASGMFVSMGWALVDADKIVADLWRASSVVEAAVERWGDGILENGAVVHSRVGALIFGDRAEYDWAMNLLHPLVKKKMRLCVEALLQERKSIVAEIPMLFEAGVPPWIDLKLFVTASSDVRLKRCLARGWDEDEMSRRESFFMTRDKRMELSDFVILNDGGLDELSKAIDSVCDSLHRSAREGV